MQRAIPWLDQKRRAAWTCLRGIPLSWAKRLFDECSATLYEKRWKEVVTFLRALTKLLPILAKTYDHDRYFKGVDRGSDEQGSGKQREEGEKQRGSPKFDPRSLTPLLHSALFSTYCVMAILGENATSKIASWGESCPCHGHLFLSLSDHHRRKMFQKHYGEGYSTCPNAGCHAPDLAAGELKTRLDAIWERREAKLATDQLYEKVAPLNREEWDIILSDFFRMKAAG